MLCFIFSRFLSLLFVLFCVVSLTFFLIRLAPGGPFDRERKIPPQIEKQLLAKYQLDGPISQQYFGYLKDLLHGDLRLSTKYRNRTVNELLAQTLPVSALLGLVAFVIATTAGVWLGCRAKSHRGRCGRDVRRAACNFNSDIRHRAAAHFGFRLETPLAAGRRL